MHVIDDNSDARIPIFHLEQLQNYAVQVEKSINYHQICYHFKHFQFSKYKPRFNGRIYEFMLYHHNHFTLMSEIKDEYNLYLTDDKNVPNGQSINSLKLTSIFFTN